MKDLKFKIVDSTGHTVVSNLDETCFGCYSKTPGVYEDHCPAKRGGRRTEKRLDSDNREFFVCLPGDKKRHQFDIVMSTLCETFTVLANHSTEPEGEKVRHLIHDISGVLGRHHFFALIPQNKLMETKYQDQLKIVQDIQRKKPEDVCRTLIYLHRDNQMMAHLFAIYRVLDCDDKKLLSKNTHKVHALLLNVFYLWRSDFDGRKIFVRVLESETKVFCDFTTVQAAFILFLDNAHKYAKGNSTIEVSFSEDADWCVMLFKMTSLYLAASERPTIFEAGRRGQLTEIRTTPGQGLGMGRIKRLMELSGGDFSVQWGERSPGDTSNNFVDNNFTFKFKLAKPKKHE